MVVPAEYHEGIVALKNDPSKLNLIRKSNDDLTELATSEKLRNLQAQFEESRKLLRSASGFVADELRRQRDEE